MNTKSKLLLGSLVTVAALMFTGCDDAADTVRNVSEQPELQGKFISPCEAVGIEGMDSISMQDEVRFTGNQLEVNSVFYSSSACESDAELGEIVYEGDFEVERQGLEKIASDYESLTEEQKDNLDSGVMKIELDKAVIRANNQTLVSLLNGISFCGMNDYEVDQEKDITSSSDEFYCPLKEVPVNLAGGYIYNEESDELTISEEPTSLQEDPASPSDSEPNDSEEEQQQAREDAAEDSVVAQDQGQQVQDSDQNSDQEQEQDQDQADSPLQIIDVFSTTYRKE